MAEDPENLSGLFWEWFLCHVSSQYKLDYNLKRCEKISGGVDETAFLTGIGTT